MHVPPQVRIVLAGVLLLVGGVLARHAELSADLAALLPTGGASAEGSDLHELLQAPDQGDAAVYLDILRGERDSTTEDETLVIGTNDRRFHAYGVQTYARWVDGVGKVRHTLDMQRILDFIEARKTAAE